MPECLPVSWVLGIEQHTTWCKGFLRTLREEFVPSAVGMGTNEGVRMCVVNFTKSITQVFYVMIDISHFMAFQAGRSW